MDVRAKAGRYLVFEIAGQAFCVDVGHAEVMLEMQPVTRIPKAQPYLRGVINHRGAVIPVVDVRQRFGLGATDLESAASIIVSQIADGAGSMTVGLLADGVREVIDLDQSQIEAPRSMGLNLREDVILGVAKAGEEFIIMLDIDGALRDQAFPGAIG